jgi:hypothetical protein
MSNYANSLEFHDIFEIFNFKLYGCLEFLEFLAFLELRISRSWVYLTRCNLRCQYELVDINIKLHVLCWVTIQQFIDSNKEQEKRMTIGERRDVEMI